MNAQKANKSRVKADLRFFAEKKFEVNLKQALISSEWKHVSRARITFKRTSNNNRFRSMDFSSPQQQRNKTKPATQRMLNTNLQLQMILFFFLRYCAFGLSQSFFGFVVTSSEIFFVFAFNNEELLIPVSYDGDVLSHDGWRGSLELLDDGLNENWNRSLRESISRWLSHDHRRHQHLSFFSFLLLSRHRELSRHNCFQNFEWHFRDKLCSSASKKSEAWRNCVKLKLAKCRKKKKPITKHSPATALNLNNYF